MVTKRSGKSWGIYRYHKVKIQWVTASLLVLLRLNPVGYSCNLQRITGVRWFAVCQSDDDCSFPEIYYAEWQLKSPVWQIHKGHYLTARTSVDVCNNTSPGSYINQTLTIKSWGMVIITIPNDVTVKQHILLCSKWLNLPTLTSKTQRASLWATSCNMEYLTQHHGQHKIQ